MGAIKRFEDLEIWQLARELINGEVKNMYYLAEYRKYVTPTIASDRRKRTEILKIKITNFMFYLKK